MKKFFITTTAVVAAAFALSACEPVTTKPNADAQQQRQTTQMVTQAANAVGMPSITEFFEKRMVRMLYEIRDNPEFTTYSYIVTMDGTLVPVCADNPSIGYGINASIQYSNPMRVYHDSGVNGITATFIPQPEPNALFMPEGLAATYVMCSIEGEIKPVYVEPEVLVSPFPRHNIEG